MKHKHADLIHAWADGAEIQFKDTDGNWTTTLEPSWCTKREYRIKPEEKKPVVRWLWANKDGQTGRWLMDGPLGEFNIKLEWSRTEFSE